jgi:hypothetical protein
LVGKIDTLTVAGPRQIRCWAFPSLQPPPSAIVC